MARSHTNQAVATARYAEQAAWLWQLQLQGFTFSQMRQLSATPLARGGLGVELSEATIHRRLVAEGDRIHARIGEMREAWQSIELERLEGIHNRYFRMAEDGAQQRDAKMEAVGLDGMLRVAHERRAFMGTNAIAKVEATVTVVDNSSLGLDDLLIARAHDDSLRMEAR